MVGIVSGKPDVVKIAWDKEALHPDDPTETVEKLTDKKIQSKNNERGRVEAIFSRIKTLVTIERTSLHTVLNLILFSAKSNRD